MILSVQADFARGATSCTKPWVLPIPTVHVTYHGLRAQTKTWKAETKKVMNQMRKQYAKKTGEDVLEKWEIEWWSIYKKDAAVEKV